MNLRPELLPPPVAPERIAELAAAITRIAGLMDTGRPYADELAAFNTDTGGDLTPHDFHTYDSWGSAETYAHLVARPGYPRIPDITRDELVEIARRIMDGPGPQADDPDADWYTLLFDTNITRPGASGLIFHPPAELGPGPTPEQIVDTALAYRPIAL
ncbi:hypothetical protein Ait01nite_012060 [Actinoplanes italicus]|uniref:Uncharacterized protein n=1 Tax=Actinoplanes italicus TaxID=113567 RepID=A0A2T0KGT8_9ACTN|nr:hypothetical protein [Actinoplanes italicus]PRX22641.1 hypothetical protein CLV67_104169 [Actinoplanes italicus]GIE28161.1 hypothetical protein Ait01nite_012060 [Actinoplanes italicus]